MLNLIPDAGRVPYFIFAPAWTHKSSGVRALHMLCHALNERGQKAYLFPSAAAVRHPFLNTPFAMDVMNDFEAFKDSGIAHIVVYPDIVKGNPLGAKKVVRWLLAPAGAYGGDIMFLPSDKVYGYTKDIAEPVLCLPTFDYKVFYPPYSHSPRNGAVFYSHKYDKIFGNKLLPLTENAARLEGLPKDIANMLRAAEVCYLYERSEIFVLASMCGCRVETIKTDFWDGVMPEELQPENLPGIGERFEVQLSEFIQDTQRWTR